MPDLTMCSSATCPIAARCRRHEASGTRLAERQRFDEWHWRRDSWSEAVVCNGFEVAVAEASHE